MNKQQAEQLLRSVLAQINLPLQKHQELQQAVDVLRGPIELPKIPGNKEPQKIPDTEKKTEK